MDIWCDWEDVVGWLNRQHHFVTGTPPVRCKGYSLCVTSERTSSSASCGGAACCSLSNFVGDDREVNREQITQGHEHWICTTGKEMP
jgi:hypothetical protein